MGWKVVPAAGTWGLNTDSAPKIFAQYVHDKDIPVTIKSVTLYLGTYSGTLGIKIGTMGVGYTARGLAIPVRLQIKSPTQGMVNCTATQTVTNPVKNNSGGAPNYAQCVAYTFTFPDNSFRIRKGQTAEFYWVNRAEEYTNNSANRALTILRNKSNPSQHVSGVVKEVATYKVAYNTNGGTGGPTTSQTKIDGDPLTLSAATPTKSCYIFKNWNTKQDGTGTAYAAGATYTANANVTLYAQWTPITYIIKFDKNGGSGTMSNQSFLFDVAQPLNRNQFSRSGYTFLGWSLNSAATTPTYTDGQSVVKIGTVHNKVYTLYAIWQPIQYTLTYDANGGTDAPSSASGGYNQVIRLDSSGPTWKGHNCLGWNTKSDGTGTSYALGAQFTMPAQNVTLYAMWEIKTCTLTYSVITGGHNPPEPQSGTYGETIIIASDTPSRVGYTFLGWSIYPNINNPTVEYRAGDEFIIPDTDTTLYAMWEPEIHTVSFDLNADDARGDVPPLVGPADSKVPVPEVVPTRYGYTFLGWSRSSSSQEVHYTPGSILQMPTIDVSVYAVWEGKTYTIYYATNAGPHETVTNMPAPQSTTFGTSVVLSSNIPARSGYQFMGWALTPSGAPAYDPGQSLPAPSRSVTLYAIWSAQSYTITYDANGGTGNPEPQIKSHGIPLKLSTTIPTNADQTFIGWNTKRDGTGTSYAAGSRCYENADTTLYAQWASSVYTVSYDANGGTDAPGPQQKGAGTPLTLSNIEPVLEGFRFVEWNTEQDGSGTSYAAGGQYTVDADVMLYAQWTTATYVITYDANGGETAPASQTKVYGQSITLSNELPTYGGRTFIEWRTSPNLNSGVAYNPGDTYSEDADLLLYAIWDIRTYVVTYDANGGTGAPESQIKNYGEALSLTEMLPVPPRYSIEYHFNTTMVEDGEGNSTEMDPDFGPPGVTLACIFTGWNTSRDGTGISYAMGQLYYIDADVTLYAQWEYPEATISESILMSPGQEFLGWSTSKTGPVQYTENQVITLTESLDLYAIWGQNSYTVTFDLNGGNYSGSVPLVQEVAYGADAIIPTPNPTKYGKTFQGWMGDPTNVTTNRKLLALWDSSPIWIRVVGNKWAPLV